MSKRIIHVSRWTAVQGEVSSIHRRVTFRRGERLGLGKEWLPAVDICETEKEVHLAFELPGVGQADITLLVHHSGVELRGRKKPEAHPKRVNYLRLEREFGLFRRIVALPCSISPESAVAVLRNGVLNVVLKKSA